MLFSLALDLPYFRFIEFARNLDRKSFVLFPAQKKTSDSFLNNKINEMIEKDLGFFSVSQGRLTPRAPNSGNTENLANFSCKHNKKYIKYSF